MEVKINKEIREYSESIFFGLNLRQLIFSLLAMGAAVAVYFLCKEPLGTQATSWLCILSAIPFALLGFVRSGHKLALHPKRNPFRPVGLRPL